MRTIHLFSMTGSFAENKDIAQEIRLKQILPSLEKNESVIIDFDKVTGATQSFIHAMISDVIRKNPDHIYDLIGFQNCNETVKKIITIVYEYMNESLD